MPPSASTSAREIDAADRIQQSTEVAQILAALDELDSEPPI